MCCIILKKTLELENMEIHGRMMEFIRELIGEKFIKVRVGGFILQNKQTDFANSTRRSA